jgi:hypothetical protein
MKLIYIIIRSLPVTAVLFLSVLFFIDSPVYAESVFLNDGSIIDGKIIKDTTSSVDLKVSNGTVQNIKKANLLRILYNDDYRRTTRISLYSGELYEGFIVQEDSDSYTIRKQLTSKEEKTFLKKEVEYIERARIEKRNSVNYWIPVTGIIMMPASNNMKKHFEPGYGGLVNFTISDLLSNYFDLGITLGGIYFKGKDSVAYSVMVPVLLNLKYRFVFLNDFSVSPSLSAGESFNSISSGEEKRSVYTNDSSFFSGEYNRELKYSFEPFTMAGIELNWNISSDLYLLAGVFHTAVYESSGSLHSIAFTVGCGMKI